MLSIDQSAKDLLRLARGAQRVSPRTQVQLSIDVEWSRLLLAVDGFGQSHDAPLENVRGRGTCRVTHAGEGLIGLLVEADAVKSHIVNKCITTSRPRAAELERCDQDPIGDTWSLPAALGQPRVDLSQRVG